MEAIGSGGISPDLFDEDAGAIVERGPADWRKLLRAFNATVWVEADGSLSGGGRVAAGASRHPELTAEGVLIDVDAYQTLRSWGTG
jgi:hypothetical protein